MARIYASPATGEAVESSSGVDVGEISGKRLYLEFAAFGFFKRECQLELKENGDCEFSRGMVAKIGAWRVEVRRISHLQCGGNPLPLCL